MALYWYVDNDIHTTGTYGTLYIRATPKDGYKEYIKGDSENDWSRLHDNVYWYITVEEKCVLPEDCSGMFYYATFWMYPTKLDLTLFDTSNVKDMSNMFYWCIGTTELDISTWDFSNVENMDSMFWGNSNLEKIDWPASHPEDPKLTSMTSCFYGCGKLTEINLYGINTRNVTNFYCAFAECSSISYVNELFFNNAKNASYMFWGDSALKGVNCYYKYPCFYGAPETTAHMFDGCSSITNLEFSNMGGNNLISAESMLSGCSSLTSVAWCSTRILDTCNISYIFNGCSSLETLDLHYWHTGDSEVTIEASGAFKDCSKLAKIYIPYFKLKNSDNTDEMFANDAELTEIHCDYDWDTNGYKSENTFDGCISLPEYTDGSGSHAHLYGSGTTNGYFYSTERISGTYWKVDGTTLYLRGYKLLGYENYDGSEGPWSKDITNVVVETSCLLPENCYRMFYRCTALTSIDVSSWDTSNVTDMSYMFCGVYSATDITGIENFDTSKVTNMESMFANMQYLSSLNLVGWDLSSVTNMNRMFYGSRPSVIYADDWRSITTSLVSSSEMFTGAISLPNNEYYRRSENRCEDIRAAHDCNDYEVPYGYFNEFKLGTYWRSDGNTLYLRGNSEDGYEKYAGEEGEWPKTITSIVTETRCILPKDISCMFKDCTLLTAVSFDNLDSASVRNICNLFENCTSLYSVDFNKIYQININDWSYVFSGCSSLEEIDFCEIKMKKASSLFANCTKLSTIKNLVVYSGGDSLSTTTDSMFLNCSSLTSLDLSKWQPVGTINKYITNAKAMFKGCTSLESIDLTSICKYGLFHGVSDATEMFMNCYALTSLTLTGSFTWTEYGTKYIKTYTNLKHTDRMFSECCNLKTIYSNDFYEIESTVESSSEMFHNCVLLPYFDASVEDVSAAHDCNDGIIPQGYFNENDKCTYYKEDSETEILYLRTGGKAGYTKWSGCYPSHSWSTEIEKVIVENNMTFYNAIYRGLFWACSKLKTLDLRKIDVSNVTNLEYAFRDCSSLETLDISGWNMPNITALPCWLAGCSSLKSLNIDGVDFSNITDMNHLFTGSNISNIDLSKINTSNVTNMSGMFSGILWDDPTAIFDISSIDTSKVTNMSYMFSNIDTEITLDFTDMDTSSVTDMSGMFSNLGSSVNLDISGLNTSTVTNMSNMFYGFKNTVLDISGLDTRNVTNMSYMFSRCSVKSLDLESLSIDNVKDFSHMFEYSGMDAIYASDWKYEINTSEVTSDNMFNGCSNLPNYRINKNDLSITCAYNAEDGGLFNEVEDGPYWIEDTSGYTLYLSGKHFYGYQLYEGGEGPWDKGLFTCCVENKFTCPSDCHDMFKDCRNLKFANDTQAARFDTSKVTNMSGMFSHTLFGAYVNSLDFSNVTDMSNMFNNCAGTYSFYLKGINTSKVTNMSGLFANCKNLYSSLNVEFDTSNVTDMSNMFYGVPMKTFDVSTWNTSKVTNMSGMFGSCSKLTKLDLSNFNVTNLENSDSMFDSDSELLLIKASDWSDEAININSSTNMFNGCTKLINFTSEVVDITAAHDCNKEAIPYGYFNDPIKSIYWKVEDTTLHLSGIVGQGYAIYHGGEGPWSKDITEVIVDSDCILPTDCNKMFYNCSKLTSFDFSNINTSEVTNIIEMFDGCSSLETLNINNLYTNNITSTYKLFNDCSALTSLDLSQFNTYKVTDMSYMFNNCSSISSIDISSFNTINTKNMSYMFNNCSSIESIANLETLNTSSVKNMTHMFDGCCSISSLNVSSLNTLNVTDMSYMFNSCSKLSELDLDNFITSKVTNMSYMFAGCSALTSIDISKFSTIKLKNLSHLFSDCTKLSTINVSNLDTSLVTDLSSMFYNCKLLTTLNLNSFSINSATDISDMFNGCVKLYTIYANDWNTTTSSLESTNMFSGCTSLPNPDSTSLDVYAAHDCNEETLPYGKFNVPNPGIYWKVTGTVLYFHKNWTAGYAKYRGSEGEWSKDITTVSIANGCILPENCNSMFYNCTKLTSINMNNFNASNVTDMSHMFEMCTGLTSINLSNLDTSNVTTLFRTFKGCTSLTEIDLSKLSLGKVINMEELFMVCSGLTSINLNNIDTSSCNNMSAMFSNCSSITKLYLGDFNVSKVTSMNSMFYLDSNLTNIYASDWKDEVPSNCSSNYMFTACSKLPNFSSSNVNVSMAYSADDGGYFNDINYKMFIGSAQLTSTNIIKFKNKTIVKIYKKNRNYWEG